MSVSTMSAAEKYAAERKQYQIKLDNRPRDPMLTAQQVFDKVATHLLTQNEKSVGNQGHGCFYRNQRGLKCAAGCLIPDDVYDPTLEGAYWDGLDFIQDTLGLRAHRDLICDLQKIHDNFPTRQWRAELGRLGRLRELNTEVCDVSNPAKVLALQES